MQVEKKGVNPALVALGAVLAVGLIGGIAGGYVFRWSWAGIGSKTLWDWMSLLFFPVVVAVVGALFATQQNRLQLAAADQQSQLQRAIEDDSQQEAELRAYLDRMSDLILQYKLWTPPPDASTASPPPAAPEVRELARMHTLTAVRRLNGQRTGFVLQFLSEYELICGENPTISLNEADLSGAVLSDADLHGADLHGADLSGARLTDVDLRGADLGDANLSWIVLYDGQGAAPNPATLTAVFLSGATLQGTIFSGVTLQAVNLDGAHLDSADLSGAALKGATLRGATLTEADLSGATMEKADLSAHNQKVINSADYLAPLRGALLGVDLTGADLTRANLSGAKLSAVTLTEASFAEANLCGADLSQAKGQPKSFARAQYDRATKWPPGVRPDAVGAVPAKS